MHIRSWTCYMPSEHFRNLREGERLYFLYCWTEENITYCPDVFFTTLSMSLSTWFLIFITLTFLYAYSKLESFTIIFRWKKQHNAVQWTLTFEIINSILTHMEKLTLSWRRPLSYRNMGWFLYDNGLRHERVKVNLLLSLNTRVAQQM